MVKVEELLGAGALAILAKKLMEGATTTSLPVGTTTGRFFGGRPDITQEEYQKGLTTFLQDLSAGPGAFKGYGPDDLGPGTRDPKEIVSLWQPGSIDLKMPVDIQPYVGPSTFKFGTKIDNSGKLSL